MDVAMTDPVVSTPNEFADWMADAAPGATVVYFRGNLAQWRYDISRPHADLNAADLELRELVGMAWRCGEDRPERRRQVRLTQRRLGDDDFEYRATMACSLRRAPEAG